MPHNRCLDFVNARTMSSRETVAFYSRLKGLYPIEKIALSSIEDQVRGQSILDLGVGGGRTVAPLREISSDYIGLDYSKDMVRSCQQNFPDAEFIHGDARDLSQFRDNSFTLIVFSNEGLCMVNHAGRFAILSEVQRLLRPGGVFLFSSYNTASVAHDGTFVWLKFTPCANPIRLGIRVGRCITQNIYSLVNRMRFKKFEIRMPEFSIINDVYHYYSTLLYYMSIDNQKRQLRDQGFSGAIDVVDSAGFVVMRDSSEKTLCYLARK